MNASSATRFKPPSWTSRTSLLLLIVDIVALILCFNIAHWARLGWWIDGFFSWAMAWPLTLVLVGLYVFDAYQPSTQTPVVRFVARTVMGIGAAGVLISLFVYLAGYWGKDLLFGRGIFSMALLLYMPSAAFTRYMADRWEHRRATRLRWLVLGAGERAALLYNDYRASGLAWDILFVPSDDEERATSKLPLAPFTVEQFTAEPAHGYTAVVITADPPLSDELVKRLMEVRFRGTRIYDLTGFYENIWFKVPVMHMRSGWFVFSEGFELLHNPVGLRVKRLLDVAVAVAMLLITSPLLPFIALVVRFSGRGPVIFRQRRRGENGEDFTVYKFRTMIEGAQRDGAWTFQNDPRITRVGGVLRLFRLDELPQLINVIRGDMSFIGPRPEAVELSELYEREIPFYQLRYMVKPGITGWAQVMYRYGSSVEDAREKLQYDLYYIKSYSLLLDLIILLKTLRVVLLGRGR